MSVPGLDQTAFPYYGSITGKIYGGEKYVRDFLFAATVAEGEVCWKWHVQFIIGDVTKPAAC